MVFRTAIVVIIAFIATVSECQQDMVLSANHSLSGNASLATMAGENATEAAGLCWLTTVDEHVHDTVFQMLSDDKAELFQLFAQPAVN